jgi:adenine-specific DNA methylase
MKLQVVGPDGRNVELEKILTNPKQRGRFIEWVKKNNYNLDVFYLLEAIVEFKRSKDSAKLSKRAKKIMDRYFPKKQALTVLELPEPIRTETITSYEKQANTLTKEFFARLETYVSQQLVKDFLPMFIKSDFFKEVDS